MAAKYGDDDDAHCEDNQGLLQAGQVVAMGQGSTQAVRPTTASIESLPQAGIVNKNITF